MKLIHVNTQFCPLFMILTLSIKTSNNRNSCNKFTIIMPQTMTTYITTATRYDRMANIFRAKKKHIEVRIVAYQELRP